MHSYAKVAGLAGIAALGLVASPVAVLAADLAVDYPAIEAPEPMALPAAGGWYLRGDIGYKAYSAPKGSMSNPAYGGDGTVGSSPYLSNGLDQMIGESMGNAADIGYGVGYKFNDYLRADLTLDYETPAQIRGSLWCEDPAPCGTTGQYLDSERAKVAALTGLLNGYVDIGTYAGFTPYVGAGAGVSYLMTSNVRSSNKDTTTGYNPSGDNTWNFAWALMAGVSYAFNQNLSLDLGYRYLNLGEARTGFVTDAHGEATRMKYDNIQAHEVRLGLRYMLN